MSDLSSLQEKILTLQEAYDLSKKSLDAISKELEGAKSDMLAHMVESKIDSFKNDRGTITLNRRFQVLTPKGDDLDAFFNYLGEAGSALRTINYQTLQSWYKEQMEAAGDNAPFLKIPGLAPATCNEFLSVRRK